MFTIGSVPMFSTLKDISLLTTVNPGAQVCLNMPFYFGISMPAFMTLHIIEHTLPVGKVRLVVKCPEVLDGLPFCISAEIFDRSISFALKTLKLPTVSLEMSSTIGLLSDLKLTDIIKECQQWQLDAQEKMKRQKIKISLIESTKLKIEFKKNQF